MSGGRRPVVVAFRVTRDEDALLERQAEDAGLDGKGDWIRACLGFGDAGAVGAATNPVAVPAAMALTFEDHISDCVTRGLAGDLERLQWAGRILAEALEVMDRRVGRDPAVAQAQYDELAEGVIAYLKPVGATERQIAEALEVGEVERAVLRSLLETMVKTAAMVVDEHGVYTVVPDPEAQREPTRGRRRGRRVTGPRVPVQVELPLEKGMSCPLDEAQILALASRAKVKHLNVEATSPGNVWRCVGRIRDARPTATEGWTKDEVYKLYPDAGTNAFDLALAYLCEAGELARVPGKGRGTRWRRLGETATLAVVEGSAVTCEIDWEVLLRLALPLGIKVDRNQGTVHPAGVWAYVEVIRGTRWYQDAERAVPMHWTLQDFRALNPAAGDDTADLALAYCVRAREIEPAGSLRMQGEPMLYRRLVAMMAAPPAPRDPVAGLPLVPVGWKREGAPWDGQPPTPRALLRFVVGPLPREEEAGPPVIMRAIRERWRAVRPRALADVLGVLIGAGLVTAQGGGEGGSFVATDEGRRAGSLTPTDRTLPLPLPTPELEGGGSMPAREIVYDAAAGA